MKLKITIGREQLMFFAIFLIALAFMGLVAAYGGSQPSVMGHSAGELDLAPLYITGGNVGIGTASPQAKLEVAGDVIIANRANGMAYRTTEYPSPVANQWFDVPLDANSNLVNVVHSTTVNPARVTVNVAGTYLIHYYVYIDRWLSMTARARLYKNGVSEILGSYGDVGSDANSISNQVITSLSANDYITLQVNPASTERDVDAATLTIVKIGP